MNKEKLYNNIIQNRINNPLGKDIYGEKHHIIPKSLGGSNLKKNLVKLTAREHFIVHYLLSEMYKSGTNEWYKMQHAFHMMCMPTNENKYINSRLYELKKIDFNFRTFLGKTHTDETKLKMSIAMKGKGDKHSGYGSCWIHNLKLEQSKKIKKDDLDSYIKEGWIQGRIVNFDAFNEKKNKLCIEKQSKIDKAKELTFNNISFNKNRIDKIIEIFNINVNENFQENVLILKNKLYDLYINSEYSTTDIAKIYNTNDVTIRSYLMLFKIPLRTRYTGQLLKWNK